MAEHAKKFGAEIVTDTVERIRGKPTAGSRSQTARGETYRSQAVILHCRRHARETRRPGRKEYAGKRRLVLRGVRRRVLQG